MLKPYQTFRSCDNVCLGAINVKNSNHFNIMGLIMLKTCFLKYSIDQKCPSYVYKYDWV